MGKKYLEGLGDALDRIEASTLSVMQDTKNGGLTIHLFQSLAQMWLIPQLDDFLSSNPEIPVKLITKPDEIEFSGSSIDIAIRYATEKPNDYVCEKLIDDAMMPVVSPDYRRHYGVIETPEDLLGRRLIGCEYDPHEWNRWFEEMGIANSNQAPKLMFDSRSHALLAAREGMGVAMNRRPYGDFLLKRGLLVAPFSEEVRTAGAYYFIARNGRPVWRASNISRPGSYRSAPACAPTKQSTHPLPCEIKFRRNEFNLIERDWTCP